MESTELLTALEAELKAIDAKRGELAEAIETIRGIIVIGKPTTKPASPVAAKAVPKPRRKRNKATSCADRAIGVIEKAGRPVKMSELIEAIGDPKKDRQGNYGNIFSALTRRAKSDKSVALVSPGTWDLKKRTAETPKAS